MPKTANFRSPRLLGAVLVFVLAAFAGIAFTQNSREEGARSASTYVQQVETKKVCMINNQVFDKDQIPVEVEGRTYYGCCDMCKERLANDPSSRQAVDPVSGETVDKSEAVIGMLPDGRVLYFESEETLGQYQG